MRPVSEVFRIQSMFDDCVFEANFIDRATVEDVLLGTFNGDAALAMDTVQNVSRPVLALDGTGDYVDFGDIAVGNRGAASRSIEAIFKTNTVSENYIVSKQGTSGSFWQLTVTDDAGNSGSVRGTAYDGSASARMYGGSSVADGVWHHVVAVWDLDTPRHVIYTDGQAGTATSTSINSTDNTAALMVGSAETAAPVDFNGSIALVRIWNRALTASEAEQLAALHGFGSGNVSLTSSSTWGCVGAWLCGVDGPILGTTVTDAVSSNDGTATSLTENDVVDGIGGNAAVDFDANDPDYIEITHASELSFNESKACTISFWALPLDGGPSSYMSAVSKRYASEYCVFINDSGEIRFDLRPMFGDSAEDGIFITAPNTIDFAVWSLVTCTYDGAKKEGRIYLNANLVTSLSSTNDTPATTDYPLRIGREVFTPGTQKYHGSLQNVMLFNTALSQLQVERLMRVQQQGRLLP